MPGLFAWMGEMVSFSSAHSTTDSEGIPCWHDSSVVPTTGLSWIGLRLLVAVLVQGFHSPNGLLVFALMPPTRDDWKRIASGEIRKDEITGSSFPTTRYAPHQASSFILTRTAGGWPKWWHIHVQ